VRFFAKSDNRQCIYKGKNSFYIHGSYGQWNVCLTKGCLLRPAHTPRIVPRTVSLQSPCIWYISQRMNKCSYIVNKLRSQTTPHLPAQPAPYHQPEFHPSSSPDYHETAISSLPPLLEYSTTTSSNACAAAAARGPCTLCARARHGCWTGIGCRQCQESCAEPA
jgi:hypothetical protein